MALLAGEQALGLKRRRQTFLPGEHPEVMDLTPSGRGRGAGEDDATVEGGSARASRSGLFYDSIERRCAIDVLRNFRLPGLFRCFPAVTVVVPSQLSVRL